MTIRRTRVSGPEGVREVWTVNDYIERALHPDEDHKTLSAMMQTYFEQPGAVATEAQAKLWIISVQALEFGLEYEKRLTDRYIRRLHIAEQAYGNLRNYAINRFDIDGDELVALDEAGGLPLDE